MNLPFTWAIMYKNLCVRLAEQGLRFTDLSFRRSSGYLAVKACGKPRIRDPWGQIAGDSQVPENPHSKPYTQTTVFSSGPLILASNVEDEEAEGQKAPKTSVQS